MVEARTIAGGSPLKDSLRLAALSVAALVALAVGGCGGPNLGEAPPPPPPMSASQPAQPASDLMGGPPGQPPAPVPDQALPVTPPASATMQPIPNPEDMTPAERRQIYGDRYATAAAPAQPGAPAHRERHRQSRGVPALSRNIAAGRAGPANPAVDHGAPASAGQSSAAPASLPASVASSAGASAATAGSTEALATEAAVARANAPVRPQGKVITSSVAFLIALIVLIAAARGSAIGPPRRR